MVLLLYHSVIFLKNHSLDSFTSLCGDFVFFNRIIAKIPASNDVQGKLSHNPFKPIGHKIPIHKRGKISAVATEIKDACMGFSIAEKKLCAANENHLVT